MALPEELFTRTVVGPVVLEVIEEMGIESISIKGTSAIASTLTGTKRLFDLVSNPVNIDQNQVVTWSVSNGACCLTITVPAGASVEIIAQ